jgi:hypothetical protein
VKKLRNMVLALGAAIAAAFIFLFQCDGGLGVVGDGAEWAREKAGIARPDAAPAAGDAAAAAARCQLRLDPSGLSIDGEPAEIEDAVDACAASGAADLVVTGDARYGEFEALSEALDAAGVDVYVR